MISFCFSCLTFWATVIAERFVFVASSTREIFEFLESSFRIWVSFSDSLIGADVSLIVVVGCEDLKKDDCVSKFAIEVVIWMSWIRIVWRILSRIFDSSNWVFVLTDRRKL